MQSEVNVSRIPRIVVVFLLVSLAFAVSALMRLIPRWTAWSGGVPTEYPGVLSAVTSLLFALVLPIPVVLAQAKRLPRPLRFALWGAWFVLMAGILVMFRLEVAAVR
jgi:hypothetical protein